MGDDAGGRMQFQGADFFTAELPKCDAYVLMEVIHDWGDAEAEAILANIRRGAPRHAKLLLIEAPLPEQPGPNWTKTLDIVMLVLLGGKQRSAAQYAALLERAGFRLDRTVDAGADLHIFEASVIP